MSKKIVQYTAEELDELREIFAEEGIPEEDIETDLENLIDERQASIELQELKDWEKSVEKGYSTNFLPYDNGLSNVTSNEYGVSFGEIDNDILIKACQNDIRMLLKTFGKGFSGEIKIQYKEGHPYAMNAMIEYIDNKDKKTVYDKLKTFIAGYGFIAYKKFGSYLTRIIGEKLYKYSSDNWVVNDGIDVDDLLTQNDSIKIVYTEDSNPFLTKKGLKRGGEKKVKKVITGKDN